MEKFKALMSRKVAGVPVMLIAAIVMAVLLYFAFKMKPAPEEEELPTDEATTDGGDLPDTSQPVFGANPVIYQPSGGSVASVPQEDTNELWARRAIEWLIQNGESYSAASGAISKYVAGESLTPEETKIRDKAIAHFGIPPETPEYAPDVPATVTPDDAPAPSGVYNGPATKQGEPPLTHKVKGKSDDTPAELARLYYGLVNADTKRQIEAHKSNLSIIWPARVGTSVRIPERHDPKYYVATSATRTLYKIAAKNGKNPAVVQALNPTMNFPVKVGTRVRVR